MINRTIIDDKKLKQIFQYIETLQNHRQIKMMFQLSFMGLRCVNFCYLQIKDIQNDDFSIKNIIELSADKNKGQKKARYYLNSKLRSELKEYVKWLSSKKKITSDTYLFTSQKTGKPYLRNSLSRIFSNIYNTFGLECSTHYGRRHFITENLTAGVDITTVKTLVNHSNIQTTALYYNTNEKLLSNVVERIKI